MACLRIAAFDSAERRGYIWSGGGDKVGLIDGINWELCLMFRGQMKKNIPHEVQL